MKKLKHLLSPFLNSSFFKILFSITVFLNPMAVWFQATKLLNGADPNGVSEITFSIYAFVQLILMFYGIKQEDWRIVLAMIFSVVGSSVVIFISLI